MAEDDPEEPVTSAERGPRHSLFQYGELLAQRGNLESEVVS